MKAALTGWIVMVLAGPVTDAAAAQRDRASRPVPRTMRQPTPFGASRVPPVLRPPDEGIIHWNTPNRDGNLGGAGTGGSGGGGG